MVGWRSSFLGCIAALYIGMKMQRLERDFVFCCPDWAAGWQPERAVMGLETFIAEWLLADC